MTGNYPNLDLVNIYSYTKFGEILSICSKDIERKWNMNKGLTSIKDHDNSITNTWKIMCNNPNLDFVNINAYTKFGEILSICSWDIDRKWHYDRWMVGQNDGQPKSSIAPPFSKRGCKYL